MELTGFTSAQLHAMHTGHNADALTAILQMDAMTGDMLNPLTEHGRRAELLARYSLILAEARAAQARAQEIYAEITRRAEESSPALASILRGEITGDDAEHLTDVPMVCTACRMPVTRGTGQWVHASPGDYLDCPVPDWTPVKAMVAAGNESVPRG